MRLLNECECSKMVWRIYGITDMTVLNLLSLALKRSELEIRSNIIAQLVFRKQVLNTKCLKQGNNWKICDRTRT